MTDLRRAFQRLARLADRADDGLTDPAEMRERARSWVADLRAKADWLEGQLPPEWRDEKTHAS